MSSSTAAGYPEEALEGLKFAESLPGELALATWRARAADPAAVEVVRRWPVLASTDVAG